MRDIVYILLFVLICFSSAKADWLKLDNLPKEGSSLIWLDVYFLESDPDYGWVCGYSGATMRTTDRGKSWAFHNVGDGKIQLESIHFVDKMNGYSSGNNGVNDSIYLYKTSDGGRSWYGVSVGDNEDHKWGCYFVTKDIGLLIGGGCGGEGQRFYRTTNGGRSWKVFVGREDNTGLTDLILDKETGMGYASSSGYIWESTDLGKSWRVMSKTGDNDWQEEICKYGESFLVPFAKSCSGSGADGEIRGGARFSTDMGLSWKEIELHQSMYGAFLLDEKRGWVCGREGKILYTSDGGENWIDRDCGIDKDDHLDDIYFINDEEGWVVGRGIYKRYDYDTLRPRILADTSIKCVELGYELSIEGEYKYYEWSTGAKTRSIKVVKPGVYWAKVANNKCDTGCTRPIKILNIAGNRGEIRAKSLEFCEGDSTELFLSGEYKSRLWNTGDTGESIIVKKSGVYSVEYVDEYDCEYYDNIYIEAKKLPDISIVAMDRVQFCRNDSVCLIASEGYGHYIWKEEERGVIASGGSNMYVVKETGKYSVEVMGDNNCPGRSLPIEVDVYDRDNSLVFADYADNQYSFGSGKYGEILCKKLSVHNQSDELFVIEDIYMSENTDFSLPQGQFPIEIEAGAEGEIEVCFSPRRVEGEIIDTLSIFDICRLNRLILRAKGEGWRNKVRSKCGYDFESVLSKDNGRERNYYYRDDIYLYIKLQSMNPLMGVYSIFNLMGREIKTGALKKDKDLYLIDISGFKRGVYTVNIDLKDGERKKISIYLK